MRTSRSDEQRTFILNFIERGENKLIISDEQKTFILNFVERGENKLIISDEQRTFILNFIERGENKLRTTTYSCAKAFSKIVSI